MKVKHAHDLIGAYLCGALDQEETRTVEKHLAVCAECRADMQSQSELLGMIPDTGDSLSELEKDKIRWSVARAVYRESERAVWRTPIWRALRGISAAAAAACIFAAGVFVGIRHTGAAPGATAIRPSAPVRKIESRPLLVKPEKAAPRPSGRDAYLVRLPEKTTPPARVRKYDSISPKTDQRRHSEVSTRSVQHVTIIQETVPPPVYAPPEPVRAVKTAMAQLPPGNNGAAAVPLTGDDVRPIRLPVEGD